MSVMVDMTIESASPQHPALSRAESWREWIGSDAPMMTPSSRARLLLVSYQFPPTGGSGVQRPAKLVKYLHAFGWTVDVLTAAHDRFPWSDPSLLNDTRGCRVHRVAGLEPACVAQRLGAALRPVVSDALARRLADGLHWRLTRLAALLGRSNGESAWVPSAATAGRRLASDADVMITTGPPHFVHRVGLRVRRQTGLPWIADLRDPLVTDYYRSPASARQVSRMRRLERAIMSEASAVVTTCPSLAAHLAALYPTRAAAVHVIPNGFDRDDLRNAWREHESGERAGGECVLVAAGAFYGRRELARLLEPLEQLLARRPEWSDRVRLILAGTIDTEQRRQIEARPRPWLRFVGYLDHAEAIRLSGRAACSVIVVPECGTGRMTVPAKTFELLALPIHVLALVPPGSDTDRIVRTAGAATSAPLEDPAQVTAALESIVSRYFDGSLPRQRDWRALDVHDRQFVAARFTGLAGMLACPEKGVEA